MFRIALYIIAVYTLFMQGVAYASQHYLCSQQYAERLPEAFEICRKAVDNGGPPDTQRILGSMYYTGWGEYAKPDKEKALSLFTRAANGGDAQAQYNLGVMYEQGEGGVNVDYEKAVKWFRKAATAGLAQAQFNLANMYSKGAGTRQNQKVAFKWYEKAAKQGMVDAQYNLGNRYAVGNGVKQDAIMSYMWYGIAAKNGHSGAAGSMEYIERLMSQEHISEAKILIEKWRPQK